MINLSNIHKTYYNNNHSTQVLCDFSLHIKTGETVAILGPSGCGKSTLLNIIGCLEKPCKGSYFLDDVDIMSLNNSQLAQHRNQTMGFVFQEYYLLPQLSVSENICLPLQYSNRSNQSIQLAEMLALVGLTAHANKKPNQLSGGQQQRVAIARALINQPKIILADEPTGSLDVNTGEQILQLLLSMNRQLNTTLIIVTHDKNIAKHCHRSITITSAGKSLETRTSSKELI